MDRLVCGDVGYGKTEVAMRAAFLVAYSGRQVARQHERAFAFAVCCRSWQRAHRRRCWRHRVQSGVRRAHGDERLRLRLVRQEEALLG